MSRFVVLYHECPNDCPRPSHWDLMLEQGNTLRTWALSDAPEDGRATRAVSLGDHRKEYLRYEGPLSHDRGSVTRWDAGTFTIVRNENDVLIAQLDGARLRGEIALERSVGDDQSWTFTFTAD